MTSDGCVEWIHGRARSRARPSCLSGEYPGDVPAQNWGYPRGRRRRGRGLGDQRGPRVSRIDPTTGRRVARIHVDAVTIAAGREGVWFVSGDDTRAVGSIDPRTNRPGQKIKVGARICPRSPSAAAGVGDRGGRRARLADRPGARPALALDRRRRRSHLPGLRRRGDLDWRTTSMARSHTSTWRRTRSNPAAGRRGPVARRRRRHRVGQHRGRDASPTGCPDVRPAMLSGGRRTGRPDRVGPAAPGRLRRRSSGAMADAIELVLKQHGFRAGRYTVGYRSCDDSTAQSGTFDLRALRGERERLRAARRSSWR